MGFRIFFIVLLCSAKIFSANIMVIPLDVNYTNEKEASIASDFFDDVNSAVLDSNAYLKNNDINYTLFLKQSLLPRFEHHKIISKFYKNDTNTTYLKKVSKYYDLDILVFMKKKIKNNKNKLKLSVFVYKINNKKVSSYSKKVSFSESSYSLDEKLMGVIKTKLVRLITE